MSAQSHETQVVKLVDIITAIITIAGHFISLWSPMASLWHQANDSGFKKSATNTYKNALKTRERFFKEYRREKVAGLVVWRGVLLKKNKIK